MSSISASKVLILGGTGQIGRFITNAIVNSSPAFDTVAIFTAPGASPAKEAIIAPWRAKGLKVIIGDVSSDDDVRAAYRGFDTVVSCLGRNVLAEQVRLLTLADEADSTVQWFFPSEYGTDVEYSPKSANERPHQFKLAVRRHARENLQRVRVTYVVTGPYPEMWFSTTSSAKILGGYDVSNRKAYVIDDGEGKIGFTTMPDVGKFVVAALQHPETSLGRALKVQSFVVTPNAVLNEFERQTGGQKWTVEKTPLSTIEEIEARAWQGDSPAPFATGATLRRIWAEGGTLYEKTDNESIGVKPGDVDTLEETVRSFLAESSS